MSTFISFGRFDIIMPDLRAVHAKAHIENDMQIFVLMLLLTGICAHIKMIMMSIMNEKMCCQCLIIANDSHCQSVWNWHELNYDCFSLNFQNAFSHNLELCGGTGGNFR